MELTSTPLHATHIRLGAKMMPFAGFDMPVSYDGIIAEHARTRNQVGLFDVSHMGELRIRGPEALDVANRLITNDLNRIKDGRALYTCMCAEDGTIIDDLITYRFSPQDIFICLNAANRHGDIAHMRAHAKGDAELIDESDDWAQIAVQGPKAVELIRRVLGEDMAALRPFRIREVELENLRLYFSTTGYTGEPGGEIYVPRAAATQIWSALLDAGQDLGVGPVGLGARDTLRLEMAYCLYGNDIDRTTTPLEANLAWVVRMEKTDFVGRAALERQVSEGVTRKLVGIELTERGIPRPGYPVLHAEQQVGTMTSGTKSPSTGRSIGLAYLPIDLCQEDTSLMVDCRGQSRTAKVVPTPFYQSNS
jgi:aminomethyltransferase